MNNKYKVVYLSIHSHIKLCVNRIISCHFPRKSLFTIHCTPPLFSPPPGHRCNLLQPAGVFSSAIMSILHRGNPNINSTNDFPFYSPPCPKYFFLIILISYVICLCFIAFLPRILKVTNSDLDLNILPVFVSSPD